MLIVERHSWWIFATALLLLTGFSCGPGSDGDDGATVSCEFLACESYQVCDDSGRPRCVSTCDGFPCAASSTCELVPVPCNPGEFCEPVPQCVAGDLCTRVACAEHQSCVLDDDGNGLERARCEDSCANFPCPEGFECELRSPDNCTTAVCPEIVQCVPLPCTNVRCAPHQRCEVDASTGLAFCEDTCDDFDCPAGSTCVLREVVCLSEPCPPVATCEEPCLVDGGAPSDDPCDGVDCHHHQICSVREDTGEAFCEDSCDRFPCPPGAICELEPIACAAPPCPAQAICREVDRCQQPAAAGPCNAALPRWAFNAASGECQVFTYGGCGGNGNNFTTQADCERTCDVSSGCELPIEAGVCQAALPRWAFDLEEGRCRSFVYSGCGGNANNFPTHAACEGACDELDRCALPTAEGDPLTPTGECAASLSRWAFNEESASCELFTFTGCGGNTNNFETEDDCEQTCGRVDRCGLAAEAGPCPAYIPVWAFDAAQGECLPFVYGGCGGNTNRFDSQAACEGACLERDACTLAADPGPCPAALPRWYRDQASGQCESFLYGGCGGNTNNFVSLDDCEATCPTVDRCALPAEAGPCSAVIERWAFDAASDSCQAFNYGGCGGNANNFESQAACNGACAEADPCASPTDPGPCPAALPRWTFGEQSGQCEPFLYGGCGGNANNFATLDECVGSCGRTNPCAQAIEAGPCQAALQRWAFDDASGTCEPFVFGGCGGTENNFLNEAECASACSDLCLDPCLTTACLDRQTCEIWEPTGEAYCVDTCADFPCPTGSTCALQPVSCASEPCPEVARCVQEPCTNNICASHQECRVHGPTQTEYCADTCAGFPCPDGQACTLTRATCLSEPCPDLATCVDVSDCSMPPDPGPCAGAVERYAFNPPNGTCDLFIYGGCGGNANNFDSAGACQAACNPDPCLLETDPGQCTASFIRYAYDHHRAACEPFTYNGCGGNANNFISQESCSDACEQDACSLPLTPGGCSGDFSRWGFDVASGECVPFSFSGCGGNSNNFPSKEACAGQCATDLCALPLEVGPCAGSIQRWAFEETSGACASFPFSGCGGNGNNFLSEAHCNRRCAR